MTGCRRAIGPVYKICGPYMPMAVKRKSWTSRTSSKVHLRRLLWAAPPTPRPGVVFFFLQSAISFPSWSCFPFRSAAGKFRAPRRGIIVLLILVIIEVDDDTSAGFLPIGVLWRSASVCRPRWEGNEKRCAAAARIHFLGWCKWCVRFRRWFMILIGEVMTCRHR